MKLGFFKIIQNNVKGYWLLYIGYWILVIEKLPLAVVYSIGYAIDCLLAGV
jgi:hypothetical protein